jgi:hypothetical protein
MSETRQPRRLTTHQSPLVYPNERKFWSDGLHVSKVPTTDPCTAWLKVALYLFNFILPMKSRFPSGAPLWRRMS